MPELPEIETIRRLLRPRLVGQVVERAMLYRADIAATPDGRTPHPRDLLQGATIRRLDRHGKNLALIAADGRTLCIHLGMSGSLTFLASRPEPPHLHALWRLPHGWLAFHDARRFGGLRTFATPDDLLALHWSSLGPDALQATGRDLAARLGHSRRPIKAALLDQHALAGVGNIYADESLFRARLHPALRCCDLTASDWTTLASVLRAVLRHAIRHGGSTTRSYRDALGRSGAFQNHHAVYGHAGRPCPECSSTLRSAHLCGRTTTWCPMCQPNNSPNHQFQGQRYPQWKF